MGINVEDFDFLSVEVEGQIYYIFVKKGNREFYKENGFTTLGIVYFLKHFGQNNNRLDLCPLKTARKGSDDFYQYDGKIYQRLGGEDIKIAMGLKKLVSNNLFK